ncbi:MAG: hypothetical protein ABSD31_10375 [Candidatus Binataceae bacterium]|jgi:hypothetical protein
MFSAIRAAFAAASLRHNITGALFTIGSLSVLQCPALGATACAVGNFAKADSVAIMEDNGGEILLGAIEFGVGAEGLGGGGPAGPNVVVVFKNIPRDEVDNAKRAGFTPVKGGAYSWKKSTGETLNYKTLGKLKYLCDVDLSLKDKSIAKLFLKKKR